MLRSERHEFVSKIVEMLKMISEKDDKEPDPRVYNQRNLIFNEFTLIQRIRVVLACSRSRSCELHVEAVSVLTDDCKMGHSDKTDDFDREKHGEKMEKVMVVL